jgi:hypothetical protein
MVRIHFPPAESLSLSRIRFRRSRTPAFRAGVRGWRWTETRRVPLTAVRLSGRPLAPEASLADITPQCG